MNLQSQFLSFHEAIKLNNFDENAELRTKRDRILTRLREGFAARPQGERWNFDTFNQGSYAMSTGVKPLLGDYDIDVGLVFRGDPRRVDALMVKGRVFEIVRPHTTRVEWRRPCLTVYYQAQGEVLYHVDLPVYLQDDQGRLHLALGKQHSAPPHAGWEVQDPRGLIERVNQARDGEDRNQLRRVVRYLKRWKDLNFASEGQAAPRGIGLTLCALEGFQPRAGQASYYYQPRATGAAGYDDLAATLALSRWMRGRFTETWSNGVWVPRIKVKSPVAPWDDVFERMTDQQMVEFRARLDTLILALEEAQRSGGAASLVRVFGSDFPAQ